MPEKPWSPQAKTMAKVWMEEIDNPPNHDVSDILIRMRDECKFPVRGIESILVIGTSPAAMLWERQVARLIAPVPGIIICDFVSPNDRQLCSGLLRQSSNGRGYGIDAFAKIDGRSQFGSSWFDAWGEPDSVATFYWGVDDDTAISNQTPIPVEHWMRTCRWIQQRLSAPI